MAHPEHLVVVTSRGDSEQAEHPRPHPPHRRRTIVLAAASVAALVALLGSVMTVGSPSGQPPADPYRATRELRPAAAWAALFARSWDGERTRVEARSRSDDSWDQYSLSYSVDALTAAYLATGTTGYADEALSLVENVARTAVPSAALPGSQFGDAFEGWASQRADVRGREVPLFESVFWRYATSLLLVIRETPALYADPFRRERFETLLRFAEHNVMAKWVARGADDYIYRSRTHMAAHWALIALNLAALSSDPLQAAEDRSIVAHIDSGLPNYAASLHGQLLHRSDHPRAWFWSDVWGSGRPPGQDVAHGNGVLAYAVEGRDRGSGWTDRDIDGFVRELNDVVWPSEGQAAEYVDGSGSGNGWFSDGWVKLGRYAPGLQQRLEDHHPANAQFYANGALNAALLNCAEPTGAVPPPACDRPLTPLRLTASG